MSDITLPPAADPVRQFRDLAVWRFDAWQAILEPSAEYPIWEPLCEKHLDSLDLAVRYYLTDTSSDLLPARQYLSQYTNLQQSAGHSLWDAYSEFYWLLLNAYNQLFDFELYEGLPRLAKAKDLLELAAFRELGDNLLPLPQGKEGTIDQQLQAILAADLAKQSTPAAIDLFYKYHSPNRRAQEAERYKSPYLFQRVMGFLDKIDYTIRRYLVQPNARLAGTYRHIDAFVAFSPAETRKFLPVYFERDLEWTIKEYELFELMPRWQEARRRIQQRYGF